VPLKDDEQFAIYLFNWITFSQLINIDLFYGILVKIFFGNVF
jgi:hypothetical protein